MLNKLDVYDIFSLFLPGSVLIFGFIFLFPEVYEYIGIQDSLIKFTSFVIFSFIVGHLLNAIKSHSVWKDIFEGKDRHPTEYLFEKGLDDGFTLHVSYAQHILGKILSYKREHSRGVDMPSSDSKPFHYVLQLQSDRPTEKQLKLYAQYELYRTINVAIVLIGFLFLIRVFMRPDVYTAKQVIIILVALCVSYFLFRSMVKSRANYWAREVLFCAEKTIDNSQK